MSTSRSGKKRKHSSKGHEDLISKLPDALLRQILSLLPDADANRTRILSNRWKRLCAFLPYLHFKMPYSFQSAEQVNKFHDFVDKTFAVRGDNMPIQRFFLSCSDKYDYNRVLNWLRIVVTSKVQQLELRFPTNRYRIRLSWDLFKACNNTLVELTLEGVLVLDVPLETNMLFPCLKKINLVSIVYSGAQAPENLISACPVLQELCLEIQVVDAHLKTFKVSSSSLKRLMIWCCVFGDCQVVIDAPKLEYFYIMDDTSTFYSMRSPLALVEAKISKPYGSVFQLVTFASSAKILTLSYNTLLALCHVHVLNLPVFPNLVKLDVDINRMWNWDLLFNLLNNMPNLEHITISCGMIPGPYMENICWNPPVEAPACLRFKMKEIIVLNQETVKQEEFTLIRYLLKHSSILETFTVNAQNIDAERREQLLNFHHGSNLCRIEFV